MSGEAEPRKSVLASIHDLITQETKSIGNQITIGLHDAAQKGLTSVIEKIFDRTMDLNIDMRDSYDRTALHWAAECNHPEACAMLISLGAEPRCKESLGRTPLHLAARSGALEVLKTIVAKACEDEDDKLMLINDDDNNGITPLFLARQRGDEDGMLCFEFLMNNGARYDTNRWPESMALPPIENVLAADR